MRPYRPEVNYYTGKLFIPKIPLKFLKNNLLENKEYFSAIKLLTAKACCI